MNEEELKNSGKETELKTAKLAPPSAKEILGSLELTVDFLEGLPDNKRYTWTTELVANFLESNKEEIDILAKEQELLYIDLIKKGLDGFLELRGQIMEAVELGDDEKQKKIQDLNRSYKNAKQLRQMARAQALQGILANFMNPYLWTAGGKDIYRSEIATVILDEKGNSKSSWDPEIHFHKELGKFLSQSDVTEIRKFIEGFFKQNFQVNSVLAKAEETLARKVDTSSYDPKAAEVILLELGKLPLGVKLDKFTRVVVSQNTITVVLIDSDFDLVTSGKSESSGGIHFTDTVINLVRDGFRKDKIISHEDEHALNDNLLGLHQADLKEEAYTSLLSHRFSGSKQTPEQLSEHFIQSMFKSLLGNNFFITNFADEVLANKLGNKDSTNQEILDILNNHRGYDGLNVTWENIKKLVKDITAKINRFLWGSAGIVRDMKEKPNFFSPEITTFLSGKGFDDLLEASFQEMLTPEGIYAMRTEAITQIDRLEEAGVTPERIRALLSSNNPLLWKDIVDMDLNKRDIPTEDKTRITQSFKKQAEKNVDRAKRVTLGKFEFKDFGEMPEEEKNNFSEIDGVASQLVTEGYKMIKNGFTKADNFKEYKCALRKIEGANAYTIILDQYFENDPQSKQITMTTTAEIKVHSDTSTVTKDFSSNTGEKLTMEKIELLIKEAENEAGIV